MKIMQNLFKVNRRLGIKEHIVGGFWKFLISNYKKLAKARKYLKVLKEKILYYNELDNNTKELLISMFSF